MSLYLVRIELITVLISSWMCITVASREQSFSVFVMKGYGGSGSIAPLILNLDTMWMRVVKLRHGILWILFNEIYSNIFFSLYLYLFWIRYSNEQQRSKPDVCHRRVLVDQLTHSLEEGCNRISSNGWIIVIWLIYISLCNCLKLRCHSLVRKLHSFFLPVLLCSIRACQCIKSFQLPV